MLELSIPQLIKHLINMPLSDWLDLLMKVPTVLLSIQTALNIILPPEQAKKFNVISKLLVFFEQLQLRKGKKK